MSNIISKMQRAPNRIGKLPNIANMSTINFQDRILPNALYIGVKSNVIKIGDDTHTIGELESVIEIKPGMENLQEFYNFLVSLDEDQITRVIMDNTTDFKIKSLPEFVADVEREITRITSSKYNDDGQSNNCKS